MRYVKIMMLLLGLFSFDNFLYGNIHADYINQGKTYLNELDIERAIYSFSKAIEFNQNTVEAYLQRAKAYLLSNEFEKSSSDYEKAMKIDPDYVRQRLDIRVNTGGVNLSGYDSIE